MLNDLKSIPFEFHVAEGKSTGALIDELVDEFERDNPPPKKRRVFTEDELEAFCRRVILELLRKATEEAGMTTIKDLIEELEEPDDAGDEWKDR